MRKLFGVFALLVFLPLAGLALEGWRGDAPALAGGVAPVAGTQTVAVSESEGVSESAQAVCYTTQAATAEIFSKFPRAVLAAEINIAAVVETIVASYNARPPQTDITADLVMVFENPPVRTYRIFLFNDGCRVGRIDWPIELFRPLMSGVGQAV